MSQCAVRPCWPRRQLGLIAMALAKGWLTPWPVSLNVGYMHGSQSFGFTRRQSQSFFPQPWLLGHNFDQRVGFCVNDKTTGLATAWPKTKILSANCDTGVTARSILSRFIFNFFIFSLDSRHELESSWLLTSLMASKTSACSYIWHSFSRRCQWTETVLLSPHFWEVWMLPFVRRVAIYLSYVFMRRRSHCASVPGQSHLLSRQPTFQHRLGVHTRAATDVTHAFDVGSDHWL